MSEKKFKMATLGCRTNQYETQAFGDQLRKMGFSPAKEGEEAALCIVNTCTVTQSADSHSRSQIRRLNRENPNAQILVTGCLAERAREELEAIPGVSHVVPNLEKEQLLSRIFPDETLPEFSIERFGTQTRAFVKIQDGCNSFCSYCVIPYVRGRSRSRKMGEILREIEELVQNGFKEIVLTGINIGDFDGGGDATLAQLVREVDQMEGLDRIRISSIDPDEVDDALLDAVISGKKTCPSMHIVLQSGSNVVLKRMNRKYTRHDFIRAVQRLKSADPTFTFTTDIIVGFPGETERDFEETIEMVREAEFAKVHMFPYSRRPMTRAARFKDEVPASVIKSRKQRLLRLAEHIGFDLREKYVGKEMSVLIETTDDTRPGYVQGHTENFLEVSLLGTVEEKNTLVNVTCKENAPDKLLGVRI